jgi:hypothetical protein
MNNAATSAAIMLLIPSAAIAQTNTCGNALMELRAFVSRVNGVTTSELNRGIPLRCQGNQHCSQILLQQVNSWYGQQANLANTYFMQISLQCSSQGARPLPPRQAEVGLPGLNEKDVAELRMDDADRLVRIQIPGNPQGFAPK